MNKKRPLCQGDSNLCKNLASLRGRKKDGTPIYRIWCDKHRRMGRDVKAWRNPNSKRYLPIDNCAMCNDKAEHRHRIVSGSEYSYTHVLGLCTGCHVKIHRLYIELANRGYSICTLTLSS